jgi:hypothetical protein
MDNKSRVIIGADVGGPDLRTDSEKALEQIRSAKWKYEIRPESLGADRTCPRKYVPLVIRVHA